MWESIIGAILGWIPPVASWMSKKHSHREPSEYRKRYESVRFEVAEALTMYACCYSNPIDIAKTTDKKLPPMYREGSDKLRALASTLRAISETMPDDVKDMTVSKEKIYEASGYLIGLSNSFTTPYNQAASYRQFETTRKYVENIRTLLQLPTRE